MLRTIKRSDAEPDLSAFAKDGAILRVVDDRPPPLVKLGTIADGSKTTHPPLQAADMLAYSARTPDTPWTEGILKRLRGSMDYIEGHWNRDTISIVTRGLALAEEEMAQMRRTVNLFRFLNHLGITVKTVPGTLIFDFRERKDITSDDLQQMIRDHVFRGTPKRGLAAFWEDLEAYWRAKGTVIHEGLRTEMLETIAEIEAQSNMPSEALPDEE